MNELHQLRADLTQALEDRDEARAWVRRLTAERVLTCVYCGEAYPPGSPDHGADVLTAHVRTCVKHPMRRAEEERDAWKGLAVAQAPVVRDAIRGGFVRGVVLVDLRAARIGVEALGFDPDTGKPLTSTSTRSA